MEWIHLAVGTSGVLLQPHLYEDSSIIFNVSQA